MSDGNLVSRESLEQFLHFISENPDGDSSLGKELEFFERNDFHSEIANDLYCRLGDFVNGFESPLAITRFDGSYVNDGRSDKFVRSIGIQLRNFFRETFGKPTLNAAELENFSMISKILPNFHNRPGTGSGNLGGIYRASDEDIANVLGIMKDNYSFICTYVYYIYNVAESQGYSPRDVSGRGVPLKYIDDAFFSLIPSMRNYQSYTGWDRVISDLSTAG